MKTLNELAFGHRENYAEELAKSTAEVTEAAASGEKPAH